MTRKELDNNGFFFFFVSKDVVYRLVLLFCQESVSCSIKRFFPEWLPVAIIAQIKKKNEKLCLP